MARWKSRAEFLLSVIELLFLSLMVEAKCVKTRCLQGWVGHLEPKFQGGRGRPWGIFFCFFYKIRHILLSNSANCTVLRLRAVVLTQYQRVTDRQTDIHRHTDGRNCCSYSTAFAMRALRRAVKRRLITLNKNSTRAFQGAINQGSTPPLTS